MSYIKLTANYGYSTYSVSNLEAYSTIDASSASWIVSNSRNSNPDADTSWSEGSGQLNCYPFKVSGAGTGLLIKGGTIWGEVPQYSDWSYTYNNSAALRIENAPGVIIDDWRIDGVWDGIRIATGTTNFLIDDAYITNVRDDAVENDYVLSGTIRDSLFDGVFSGISLGSGSPVDGSSNTITIESTFIRNKSYLYKGEMTHVSPFKANTSAPETTPDIRIINSVFAIEDPNHESQGRLDLAWENVVESRGNVFLNLSDTPLPPDYPLPPSGFTILQGQQARDYWEACKAAWLANHDGVGDTALTALPPLPGAGPVPPAPTEPSPAPVDPTPSPINTIDGTNSSQTHKGSSGVDQINALGGNDRLYGKEGNDILNGGSGYDKFVFDTRLGSDNIDTITDFSTKDDYIWLDNSIFTKLGSGSTSSPKRLSSSWFEAGDGVKADDSNDYILYDTHTGALYYDADGNGSGAAVQFATLSPGLALSYSDIYVI
jgi:Ca2+-binding RTX toxin-like protein